MQRTGKLTKAKVKFRFIAFTTKTLLQVEFGKLNSEITFDPENLSASSALVTFDMSSVLTGDTLYDSPLPSAEWLNIKDFPLAGFQSTSFAKIKDGYLVTGDFTLLGQTRPIKIPFTFSSNGQTAEVSGLFSFSRSSFGLGMKSPDSASLSDEIQVEIHLTAQAKP